MFSDKKNNYLARFFQIDKNQSEGFSAIFKKIFYYSKLVVGIAFSLVLISNFSGSLIADDLSGLHLKEVERIFTLDHISGSDNLTMVFWKIQSPEPLPIIRPKAIDSTESKEDKMRLDLNPNYLGQISFLAFAAIELSRYQKLSCSDNSTFTKFVFEKVSQFPLQTSRLSLQVFRFPHPSSLNPVSSLKPSKMDLESKWNLNWNLNLVSDLDLVLNWVSESISKGSKSEKIGFYEENYPLKVGNLFYKIGISYGKIFSYNLVSWNQLNPSQVQLLVNLPSGSRRAFRFMEKASEFTKMFGIATSKGLDSKNLLLRVSSRGNTNLWISHEPSRLYEKHIVINLNGKILSLWHPNQNELHLVNYSTLCDAYRSKSMTTKFAKDLKHFS